MDTTTQNQNADTAARQSTHPDSAAPAPLAPSAAPAASTAPDTTSDTSPRTAPALEVHDVHKSFGTTHAVDGITLSICPGEVVALLGRNGAGKTTLIDIVLGLQQPDSGTTALFGMSPREAIRRSLVGVVHQTGALLPNFTVEQTLRVFAGTHSHPLPVDQVLEETDLVGLARRPVVKLSGGEQQRVRLALALVPDPLLLILDEPTAGMDALARRDFWKLMAAQAEAGRTIVFATHYLAEAQDFAHRTVIVKDGRVITDAPTEEVRHLDASRSLRIRIDEGARASLEPQLRALPGADEWLIEWPPGEVTIHGSGLDDAARLLLDQPGAHDLEIVASSLEDVFTALTA
ncbi:ABC transporter ATP-binding protein [Actinomyces provencensis]|uniref:ABC transporter ATP-binding protein n=1 Tax=Actinomyces provencensis TaxID=1720198 RepID=UPI00098EA096|nr:ABC transporter ATP-binding protein [Actinomyces provencensis]